MSKTTGKYSNKQKLEALKVVELEGLRPAERTLKIPRETLRKWKKNYKIIKEENDEDIETLHTKGELLLTTKEEMLEQHQIEYIPQAIEFKKMALARLKALVVKSTSPDQIPAIAGAFKIIHESMFPKTPNVNLTQNNIQNNIFSQVDEMYRGKMKK